MPERALGRKEATDDRHLQRWSLTQDTMPTTPTAVTIGINWYSGFDDPIEQHGVYALPPQNQWGSIRGGHSVCLKPKALRDDNSWWHKYNQGNEGACVAFASDRMQSLHNRRFYNSWPVYRWAQDHDEFTDTPPEGGTSVRAAMDCLRTQGLWRVRNNKTTGPFLEDGIVANRWAVSIEEVAWCLSPEDQGKSVLVDDYVTFLNSWGDDIQWGYPHYTRIDLEGLHRLLFLEQGDVTMVTDR